MKRFLSIVSLVILSIPVFGGTWVMSPGKGSHGSTTPAGNVWTIVGYNATESASNGVAVSGAVGDIVVVRISWSGGGTLTGISGDTSGAVTLQGTQVNASNGDKSARWGTVTALGTAPDNFTPTFSGSGTFRNWQIWRLSASGTKDYSISAIANGTGTSLATASFTTITSNGIVLACADIYGSATPSNALVGGNAATTTHFGTFSCAWDYKHTSQLSSATANLTISTSLIWIVNAIALSAQ